MVRGKNRKPPYSCSSFSWCIRYNSHYYQFSYSALSAFSDRRYYRFVLGDPTKMIIKCKRINLVLVYSELVKVNNCIFPEGIFYDIENFVWIKINNDKTITIGITAILASIAGKLSSIKLKKVGTELEKGKSIGTIESIKYFGVVRTPVRGRIAEINKDIIKRPKLVNDFPYTEGWIMKINASHLDKDLIALDTIENCHSKISYSIEELHIRCFAEFPDHEMFEIGVECGRYTYKPR